MAAFPPPVPHRTLAPLLPLLLVGALLPGADALAQDGGDGMAGWSYAPVHPPDVPSVADPGWVRTPVDAFVLARLESAGLRPAPPAQRVDLVRRATFDLTGLPPTPEEVDAFVADDAPDAYERLIERLLASPRYGEQWGRHWLDVVRYAETNGYERDTDKPEIWRYRDYVIDAFNADKPYDRFVLEQVAGDELDDATSESVVATGFLRLMVWDDEPGDGASKARYDMLDDVVRTTSEAFLGMTLGCARCHDHKGDPIPQEDYYSFMAFFHGLTDYRVEGTLVDVPAPEERERWEAAKAEHSAETDRVARERLAIEEEFLRLAADEPPEEDTEDAEDAEDTVAARIERRGAELLDPERLARYRELTARAEELAKGPADPPPRANAATEVGPVPDELFVHERGNPDAPGQKVEPRFPGCLTSEPPAIPAPGPDARTSGRRRALAEWLASPDNPLTARVMVNRVWQHHFGVGIVPTANDFGELGERPSHPELLDWLAGELVANSWSIKHLHRVLMLSSTYRTAYRQDERSAEIDPDNRLLWRFRMRRLAAEELRDSILAVAGRLNPEMGGPSFFSRIPAAALATSSRPGEVWGTSPDDQTYRRSVYIKVKRSLITPILAQFDVADTDSSCPVRFATVQPTQALGMMNSELLHHHAAGFAERLRAELPGDLEGQLRRGLRLALARPATGPEVDDLAAFHAELRSDFGLGPDAALKQVCLLILNLNEFLYLD